MGWMVGWITNAYATSHNSDDNTDRMIPDLVTREIGTINYLLLGIYQDVRVPPVSRSAGSRHPWEPRQ